MFILPLLQALGIPPSHIDNIEYDPRIGSLFCFCELGLRPGRKLSVEFLANIYRYNRFQLTFPSYTIRVYSIHIVHVKSTNHPSHVVRSIVEMDICIYNIIYKEKKIYSI